MIGIDVPGDLASQVLSRKQSIRLNGRKGWLHGLDGYEEKHIIMDKALG
jgi:hypothetical protein